MQLKAPFEISSRLLPSVRIADATISLEYAGESNGRSVFRWYLDCPAGEFSEADLKSGMGGYSLQDMFTTLLSFLSAAAESYSYEMRTGRKSDNADLFPAPVVEWAYQNSDEITCIQMEIEETPELICE